MRNANIHDMYFQLVKDLIEQLDSLREFCHKEDYDIYNWEVKNIEVIE